MKNILLLADYLEDTPFNIPIKEELERLIIHKFEQKLFSMLDWAAILTTPFEKYVNVTYEGKGDIRSIKLKPSGFRLTIKECCDLALFITTIYPDGKLSNKDSYYILNYIRDMEVEL